MKRYISTIVALFAVACVTTASAQEFSVGAKVGLNISTASSHGEDIEGRDQYRAPRFGASAGITAEYKFNESVSLSGEVLFSQQGVRYKYPTVEGLYDDDTEEYGSYEDCTVTHRFSYINVPILFNYYFVKNLRMSFNVGIQPGFLVSENSTTKLSNSDGFSKEYNGAYNWDLEPSGYSDAGYKVFDLAVPIGITWGFTEHITFDMRYSIGVINTFKESEHYDYDKDYRSTNNSFTLSVGYKF
ncbi:MAG: porin family protein [Rikenellaceae bacterium]